MTGTKILWGQMALSLAAVLAGLWGATEWTAMRLGFQPALGPAWFVAAGAPVYEPYLFFVWWYHFDAYAPGIFLEGAAWATEGGVMAVVIAIAGSVRRTPVGAGHDLRLGTLPGGTGGARGGVAGAGRNPSRPSRQAAPPAHRPRARPVLRANAQRQGCRPGRSDAARLAF